MGSVQAEEGEKPAEPLRSPQRGGGVGGAFSLLNHVLMEEMSYVFSSKSCRITWGMKQRAVVLTLFILFLRACLEDSPALYSQQDFLLKESIHRIFSLGGALFQFLEASRHLPYPAHGV